jgi:hypothetical protein
MDRFSRESHEKDVMSLFLQSLFFPGRHPCTSGGNTPLRANDAVVPRQVLRPRRLGGAQGGLRSSIQSYLPEWAAEMLLEEGRVPSVSDQALSGSAFSIDIPG